MAKDYILARVNNVDNCWIWNLSVDKDGYGKAHVGGSHKKAHRLSYEVFVGNIPNGLTIDHLCKNKSCVNPSHLEPVTRRENVIRHWGKEDDYRVPGVYERTDRKNKKFYVKMPKIGLYRSGFNTVQEAYNYIKDNIYEKNHHQAK